VAAEEVAEAEATAEVAEAAATDSRNSHFGNKFPFAPSGFVGRAKFDTGRRAPLRNEKNGKLKIIN
jgi:hypothetical protein